MIHPDTAVVAGLVCAVGGLAVPALIARLPEPAAQEPEQGEDPKERYVDVAARPRLTATAVVTGGVAGALIGLVVGWDLALVGLLPLVPVGVVLAVVDLRTRLLPSVVVVPATVVVVALGLVGWAVGGDATDLVRGLVGLVAARSFYWVLWSIHSAGMGFGDVRLAALLGFVLGHLGWDQLVVGMYAGFLVFGLPGLLLAIARWDRAMLRTAYPFGPAMLAGALIGVCLGEPVVSGLVARGS